MLQIEAQRQVTVVAGAGQTGKSTFALRYMVNAPDLAARFIFDPEGEYAQRLKIKPAADLGDLVWMLDKGWIVFDPNELFAGDHAGAFAFFCDFAFEMASRMPGRKVLLVDEVWKYCNPHQIPAEFATVIQTGRKRGLGSMVNTQLPNKLNGALLNEVSEMVCFYLQFEKALDVAEGFGFNRAAVNTLAPLHFISRTWTGSQLAGRIRI